MKNLIDKYQLTLQQSLFLAKKHMVNNIYSGAKVEGLNVTFPETQAIVDGVNVARLSVDDILVIRNLKNAWKYVIANVNSPFNLDFVLRVNGDVSNSESLAWGVLRTGRINIGGTDYIPPIPNDEQVKNDIDKILAEGTATDKTLNFYLYACRSQLFWDGNKRTAFVCANKILIEAGAGLLHIADKDIAEFNQKLSDYYTTANAEPIKQFLYDKCIIGIEFEKASPKDEYSM